MAQKFPTVDEFVENQGKIGDIIKSFPDAHRNVIGYLEERMTTVALRDAQGPYYLTVIVQQDPRDAIHLDRWKVIATQVKK